MQQVQWKVIHTWGSHELFVVWGILTFFLAKMTVACLPAHFIIITTGAVFWLYIASYLCESIPFFKRRALLLMYAPEIPEDGDYYALAIDEDGYILCNNTKEDTDLLSWWFFYHQISNLTTKEIWENVII